MLLIFANIDLCFFNQTFLRQKVTLASSTPASTELKQGKIDTDSQVRYKENSQDPLHSPRSLHQGTQFTSESLAVSQTESINLFMHKEGCNNEQDWKNQNLVDTCHETCKKQVHSCSRVNESSNGAGALRYAIHLRFICPFPKNSKSLQRCKSDPLSKPQKKGLDVNEERRFYLYNDLRVVFPQRHSDDDEGKVCNHI